MSTDTPQFGPHLRQHFSFPATFRNLNHGSFGTAPKPVLARRQELLSLSEQNPDHYMRYDSIALLDKSRAAIAQLLNVPTETIVFVPNATHGVNTILRGIEWQSGDVIIHFDTIYGACGRSVQYILDSNDTKELGAEIIDIVYPCKDDAILQRFEEAVKKIQGDGKKAKLVVFDVISSMPGMRFPWERMVEKCRELGVLSLIDGAHGVGNVEIDLGRYGPDFFVSNCHKWLYTPRPCAVLHVPLHTQPLIPTSIPTSHYYPPKNGTNAFSPVKPGHKSNFIQQFEFNGTLDISPYLCLPTALSFRQSIGGEAAIRKYCRDLAFTGGRRVAEMLGTEIMEPDQSQPDKGEVAMVNIRLPIAHAVRKEDAGTVYDWFTRGLGEREGCFVQVYQHGGEWWLRLSGQVYLGLEDFEWVGQVVRRECERVVRGEVVSAAKERESKGAGVENLDVHVGDLKLEGGVEVNGVNGTA